MARRLIRARHLQHPNDPYRRIAEKYQPAIAKALLQGFTKLQEHVQHVAATIGVQKVGPVDEARDDHGRWTNGAGGLADIRGPSEDVNDTARSAFNHYKVLGNRLMPINSVNSGVSVGDNPERVKALAAQIKGPDGYFSRVIVDDQGNVLEGQHRTAALRQLGATKVPVVMVKDLERDQPVEAMRAAVHGVGGMYPDQVHQVIGNTLEMIHDSGSAGAALKDFDLSGPYQKHFEAALHAAGGVAKADPPEPVNNPQKLFDRETVRVTIENSLNNLNDASSEAAIAALTAAGVSVAQASVISRGLQVGLAAYRAELVRQVTDDTIDAITGVIQDALNAGLNYVEIAREVKPLIGLTSQQVAAVNSFRGLLEEMDPTAIQGMLDRGERVWRDRRFDSTLQNTIDESGDLTADQIDTMVERYAAKALKGRATTISRTESLRAANMGAKESLTQFVTSRGLALTSMRQFWLTAMDELVCPVCSSIPAMNEGGVELGESFDSIDGPMDLPPDPHPNCRCTIAYRIVPDELKAWQEAADAGEPDTEAA